MTDDELDDLLRGHVEASSPGPALVGALVASARPRRPAWERYALALAVAASLVVALPLGVQALRGEAPESVASKVPAPSLAPPAETWGVALPRGLPTLPGFPAPGDRVSLLLTSLNQGEPEAMTLLRDVPLIGVDPLTIAVSSVLAEKLVHARSTGDLAVAVHVGDDLDLIVRSAGELALAPEDRVDVLLTTMRSGELQTRTLVTDIQVIEADGRQLRVRVSPDEAEVLALGGMVGDLTFPLRP